MSNLHKNVDEPNKHSALGFTSGQNGSFCFKTEEGFQEFEPTMILPPIINFIDGNATPPVAPISGDSYILIDEGNGAVHTDFSDGGADYNDFVRSKNSLWPPITPIEGCVVLNKTDGLIYQFNGTTWSKTDTDSQNASEVPYNNATSGLAATDVQAALDEIEARVETNDAKVSNVTTDLSEGTATATTVVIVSSDGTDATLQPASTLRAGLMSKAKFDEVEVNNAKISNVDTNLSIANKTATTLDVVSSDGTDATIPSFTSTEAGLTPASGGGTANFLRADGTWAAAGGGATLYTADGALTSARTVTQAGFSLSFIGGTIGMGVNTPAATSRLHIKGQGSTAGTVGLLVQNDVGSNLFQVRDDGVLVLASNAYADISVSGTSWLLRSNAITDRPLVTAAADDKILISDYSDSNLLKQIALQGIADLATNMYKANGTLISDRTIDIGSFFWKLRSTTSFTRVFIETSLANQYAELAFATPTGNIGFVEAFGASATAYLANRFVVQSGSVANGMILRSASTGGIKFAVGTGGDVNTYMNLTQSGLLLGNGIGASSPSARLHLIGDLRIDSQTATGATAGADTLPSNPVGFININLDGTAYKVPYYNV